MELETAARYGLPVIVVIANNQGPSDATSSAGTTRPSIRTALPPLPAGNTLRPDCVALGGHGEFVDRPEQFRGAWERALASGKPACINVIVDPYAPYNSGT